jgi:23S rRNA (pseudouridine1915-N3)-methyltransferase
MLHVTIIAVGGLKEKYLADACAEYKKRLSAFCKLEIIEIAEYTLPQEPSAAEIEMALVAEGAAVLAKIKPRAAVIPLCIEGESLTSPALAKKLEELAAGTSHIAFIIGGSHGLSEEVKRAGTFRLSMSAMTFPHRLARVMLLEQIYRAFSITRGMRYHK